MNRCGLGRCRCDPGRYRHGPGWDVGAAAAAANEGVRRRRGRGRSTPRSRLPALLHEPVRIGTMSTRPGAISTRPGVGCRSGGSRECGRAAGDVVGGNRRRLRACRRSYMNRRGLGRCRRGVGRCRRGPAQCRSGGSREGRSGCSLSAPGLCIGPWLLHCSSANAGLAKGGCGRSWLAVGDDRPRSNGPPPPGMFDAYSSASPWPTAVGWAAASAAAAFYGLVDNGVHSTRPARARAEWAPFSFRPNRPCCGDTP